MTRWQGARYRPITLYLALATATVGCSPTATPTAPPRARAQSFGSQGAPSTLADVSRGLRVLQMQGCVACHSLDGAASAGPTLAGRWGTEVQVRDRARGSVHGVRFDRHYLVRSLEHPDEELALGFAPGVMPSFMLTAEQTDAVAAALQSLESQAAPARSPVEQGLLIALVAFAFALLILWRRDVARRSTK
jgi:mono/diheme cytochrome c family protein